MKFSINNVCPCGSKKKYKKCCMIYHNGAKPKTALELMKSRYSAFAAGDSKYIIKTTHSKNPQYLEDKVAWKKDLDNFCNHVIFEGLEILETSNDGTYDYVKFRATLKDYEKNDLSFSENSRFDIEDGMIKYLDSEKIEE